MRLVSLKRIFAMAMLSSIAIVGFAEDAPVYEVDNFPPAFDSQPEVTMHDSGSAAEMESPVSPQSTYSHPEPIYSAPRTQSMTPEQRLRRIEQQVNNMQQLNSASKIDVLQKEVQSLRGQVEELSHQLLQAQNQQRAMYTDVDKRLSNLPATNKMSENPDTLAERTKDITSPSAAKSLSKAKSPTQFASTNNNSPTPEKMINNDQPNVAEEQQIYQTAYDLIKSKKYNDAIIALQKMLQKYPSGQFAANAHYWLGELYGLLNKNEQSAVEFAMVIKKYPNSPKVSDAQLKLGLIYLGQFKWGDAKMAFKKVINQYPGTASARLATEQLKQIKQAGH